MKQLIKVRGIDSDFKVPHLSFHFSYRTGDTYSPMIEEYEPLRKQCDTFLECIKKETPPPSDGNNGLRVVAILEAASKSLKQDGRQIPVCLPKENKVSRSNGNGYPVYSMFQGKRTVKSKF